MQNPRVYVARVLVTQGLFREAESILIPTYENLRCQLGVGHHDPTAARHLIIELYTRWGRPREVHVYRESTLAAGE